MYSVCEIRFGMQMPRHLSVRARCGPPRRVGRATTISKATTWDMSIALDNSIWIINERPLCKFYFPLWRARARQWREKGNGFILSLSRTYYMRPKRRVCHSDYILCIVTGTKQIIHIFFSYSYIFGLSRAKKGVRIRAWLVKFFSIQVVQLNKKK